MDHWTNNSTATSMPPMSLAPVMAEWKRVKALFPLDSKRVFFFEGTAEQLRQELLRSGLIDEFAPPCSPTQTIMGLEIRERLGMCLIGTAAALNALLNAGREWPKPSRYTATDLEVAGWF